MAYIKNSVVILEILGLKKRQESCQMPALLCWFSFATSKNLKKKEKSPSNRIKISKIHMYSMIFSWKNPSFPSSCMEEPQFSTHFSSFSMQKSQFSSNSHRTIRIFHQFSGLLPPFSTVKVPFFAEAPGHGRGGRSGRSLGRCGAWRARRKRKRNAGDADGAAGAWRGGEVNGLKSYKPSLDNLSIL